MLFVVMLSLEDSDNLICLGFPQKNLMIKYGFSKDSLATQKID